MEPFHQVQTCPESIESLPPRGRTCAQSVQDTGPHRHKAESHKKDSDKVAARKIMGLVHRSMLERSWLGDLGIWGSAKGSHVKLRSPLTKVSQCTTGKLHRGDELRLGCWSQTQINQDVNRGNFLQIPTSITNVKAPGSHLFRCVAQTACSVHGHRCLLLQACLDVP